MMRLEDIHEHAVLWRAVGVVAAKDVATMISSAHGVFAYCGITAIASVVVTSDVDEHLAVNLCFNVACGIVHTILLSQSTAVDVAIDRTTIDIDHGGVASRVHITEA